MTAPISGEVTGAVEVAASATDNDVVAGVRFRMDGVDIGSEDVQSPYGLTWNTALVEDGSHILTALARDAAGNTAMSQPVSVAVNNSLNANGLLQITVTTTGAGTDPTSYALMLDGVPHGTVERNGTVEIVEVPTGAHTVKIEGLGRFCAGQTTQVVNVTGGAATPTPIAFAIACLSPPGQIVFSGMTEAEELKVVRIEADGSNPVVLQTDARDPSWSHDRSRIAFVRSGATYFMNADGTGVTPLSSTPQVGGYMTWSPDDSRLIYTHQRTQFLDLFVIGADGSNNRPVFTTEAQRLGGDWSPDGTRIAYAAAGAGPEVAVWIANADGSGAVQLTSGGFDTGPTWSPDGTRIGYTHAATQLAQPEVFAVGLDGINPVNLSRTPTWAEYGSEWSPDGAWIAFTSTRGGVLTVWVMRADGTYAERVSDPTAFAFTESPSWR